MTVVGRSVGLRVWDSSRLVVGAEDKVFLMITAPLSVLQACVRVSVGSCSGLSKPHRVAGSR